MTKGVKDDGLFLKMVIKLWLKHCKIQGKPWEVHSVQS